MSMGYVPSEVARRLVGQPSATIGVAIADFLDPFYVSLLSSIEDAAIANEYDLFVGSFYRDRQREQKLFDAFYRKRLAGIIVAGSIVDGEYRSLINGFVPVVLVNNFSYPYSISVDQSLGAHQATAHLIALGHRRIAYVSLGTPSNTESMRFNGYHAALREYNLYVDEALVVPGYGGIIGGIKAASQLLDLPEQPTAIFCFNDMTAIGMINGLLQRGYEVPRDFSVVGFDDLDISAYYHPTITTVRQPVYQLGREAAEIMFDLIGGNENISPKLLEPELIVRDSTAQVA